VISDLKEGLSYSMTIKVEHNQTASFYGSGTLDVYATPAMIALMENASANCVQSHLEDGFTTVGIEINVKHIKATPIGMNVRSEAYVEKVDRKKLYFKVEAYDDKGKIGEGTHVRYIINSEEFMEKIK
jgi:predicted thioesterase